MPAPSPRPSYLERHSPAMSEDGAHALETEGALPPGGDAEGQRSAALDTSAASSLGDMDRPSSPATLSVCAALALLTPLVNPGSLYRCGKGD